MAALITNKSQRLLAYTCKELSAYTWAGINALPYGLKRALAALENATTSRGGRIEQTKTAADEVSAETLGELETAMNKLDAASGALLDALS